MESTSIFIKVLPIKSCISFKSFFFVFVFKPRQLPNLFFKFFDKPPCEILLEEPKLCLNAALFPKLFFFFFIAKRFFKKFNYKIFLLLDLFFP